MFYDCSACTKCSGEKIVIFEYAVIIPDVPSEVSVAGGQKPRGILGSAHKMRFQNRGYKAGKNVHTLNKAKNAEKRSAGQNGKAEKN